MYIVKSSVIVWIRNDTMFYIRTMTENELVRMAESVSSSD